MHTIGKILKTIREERGLQLRQVAIESNIDLTLLSRIENGKRMPSESLLFKLAETYGLDSNLLVLQLVSDKILEISEQYPDHTIEALKIAQEKARESNTLLRPSDIQRFALCQPSHLSRFLRKRRMEQG